jgi:hypothetical protein
MDRVTPLTTVSSTTQGQEEPVTTVSPSSATAPTPVRGETGTKGNSSAQLCNSASQLRASVDAGLAATLLLPAITATDPTDSQGQGEVATPGPTLARLLPPTARVAGVWQTSSDARAQPHQPTWEQEELYQALCRGDKYLFFGRNGFSSHRIVTILYYLAEHPDAAWVVSAKQYLAMMMYAPRLRWTSFTRVFPRQDEGLSLVTLSPYNPILLELGGGQREVEYLTRLEREGKQLMVLGSRSTTVWEELVRQSSTPAYVDHRPPQYMIPSHHRVAISYHFTQHALDQSANQGYAKFWESLGTHVLCCVRDNSAFLHFLRGQTTQQAQPASAYDVTDLVDPKRLSMHYPSRVVLEASSLTDLVLVDPHLVNISSYAKALQMTDHVAQSRVVHIRHFYTCTDLVQCYRAMLATFTLVQRCREIMQDMTAEELMEEMSTIDERITMH